MELCVHTRPHTSSFFPHTHDPFVFCTNKSHHDVQTKQDTSVRRLHGPSLLPLPLPTLHPSQSDDAPTPALSSSAIDPGANNNGHSGEGGAAPPTPVAAADTRDEREKRLVCHPERLGLGNFAEHHCGPVTALAIHGE